MIICIIGLIEFVFFRIIVRTDNQGISKLQSTEPEVSGTVFRQRNRTALQYFQVLRSGYRPLYYAGSDWVGRRTQSVSVCAQCVYKDTIFISMRLMRLCGSIRGD